MVLPIVLHTDTCRVYWGIIISGSFVILRIKCMFANSISMLTFTLYIVELLGGHKTLFYNNQTYACTWRRSCWNFRRSLFSRCWRFRGWWCTCSWCLLWRGSLSCKRERLTNQRMENYHFPLLQLFPLSWQTVTPTCRKVFDSIWKTERSRAWIAHYHCHH